MTRSHHLDNETIIRFLDGELAEHDFACARSHLAVCGPCRGQRDAFARLSFEVEALVGAEAGHEPVGARGDLLATLKNNHRDMGPAQSPSKILKRYAWGMGLAAMLAIGILVAPRPRPSTPVTTAQLAAAAIPVSIDIDGESFVPLPYSNPELPLSAPRIVEMEVPVSSLAAAGVLYQPTANGSTEGTVLANFLLGVDGQPLGVDVLNVE